MQVSHEKIAILDEYLVDHCWSCWTVVCPSTFRRCSIGECRPSRATNAADPRISESCL